MAKSDYKQLTELIAAIEKLKKEAAPTDTSNQNAFETKQQELQKIIDDIRHDIDNLPKLQNEVDIIEAKSNIRTLLASSQDLVHECGKGLKKMAKAKTKDDLVKQRSVRLGQEWLEAKQKELVTLAEKVRSITIKVSTQATNNQNKRKNRRNRRNNRGGDMLGLDDFNIEEASAETEQERAFAHEVEVARQEEEQVLQMIIQGLDELHELALILNKLLKKSAQKIEDTSIKMQSVQTSFDNTNAQLSKILEGTGGMARWCPLCVCIIVVLACVGFIVAKFTM